jgi:soluble P-type ATPase
MESINVRGGTRYRRVFSLSDFGIEIPRVKAGADKEKSLEIMEEEQESGEK